MRSQGAQVMNMAQLEMGLVCSASLSTHSMIMVAVCELVSVSHASAI